MPLVSLDLVRHVVAAFAHGKIFDADDRDDFVQDVLIKFHRKVNMESHPARQMAFAKQVASTMLIDWMRSRATLSRSLDLHAVPLPEEGRSAPSLAGRGPDRHDFAGRTSASRTASRSCPLVDLDTTLDLSPIGRLIYDGYSPSDIEIEFGYSQAEVAEVVEKLKMEILEHNSRLRAKFGKR